MSETKLLAPAGVASISLDGIEYVADEKGVVTVPEAQVINAVAFGFVSAPDDSAERAAEEAERLRLAAEQAAAEQAAKEAAERPAAEQEEQPEKAPEPLNEKAPDADAKPAKASKAKA